MGLVSDDRELFAVGCRTLPHGLKGEGKGLHGADDDLLARVQRLGQCRALATTLAGDGCNHTFRALELEQRFLQLRVDHVAVRHHNHAGEDLLVILVMQVGEEVC